MSIRRIALFALVAGSVALPSPAVSHAVGFTQTFHGLTPARLLDTRPGESTVDNQFVGSGPVGPASLTDVNVLARGGVPAVGVGSVALNVTVTNPTAASFITVYATGNDRPTASNLNVVAGQTVANMVIVAVGSQGKIRLYNNGGSADLIVDVLGWFPSGDAYTGLVPARLLDTRAGFHTVDGQSQPGAPVLGTSSLDLAVSGRGGVPATGVGSVALNVTVAGSTGNGFVTVFPAGQPQPTASNLNFTPGQIVPNMVIVPLGAGGKITLFNSDGRTELLVDVLGWFPTGPSYTGLTPARLLETRSSLSTIDGQLNGVGPVGPAGQLDVTVVGRGGVPILGVGAVALNVTATGASATTYITAWPAGAPRPTASNINLSTGQTVPNMVMVKVGAGGKISLYNNGGSTHLIVDVLGWFPSDVFPASTRLISIAAVTPPGNDISRNPSISADGRYVAFVSFATNITAGDLNTKADVFVRDRVAGTTELVSVSSAGVQGNLNSVSPSISADGRYVAFQSLANNLVLNDLNGKSDIFVRDRQAMTTIIASHPLIGIVGGDGDATDPEISADGRFVAFTSDSTNLGVEPGPFSDVFVRQLDTAFLTAVSVPVSGPTSNGASTQPTISADGSIIAFTSAANNLVAADGNGKTDIFVRNRLTATTDRASVKNFSTEGNGDSSAPSISGDGTRIAFQSASNNLTPQDFNTHVDVFVRTTDGHETLNLSIGLELAPTNGDSETPSISSDGIYVAYASDASNLVPGDLNTKRDIFVYSLSEGRIFRASVASDGTEATGDSHNAALNANGRYIAYDSTAPNLGTDANIITDVFLRDVGLA
jgi:Tol biopolymer transport system component